MQVERSRHRAQSVLLTRTWPRWSTWQACSACRCNITLYQEADELQAEQFPLSGIATLPRTEAWWCGADGGPKGRTRHTSRWRWLFRWNRGLRSWPLTTWEGRRCLDRMRRFRRFHDGLFRSRCRGSARRHRWTFRLRHGVFLYGRMMDSIQKARPAASRLMRG